MTATYINHMGDDLTVVDNARVSFAKESGWELQCSECGIPFPDLDGEPCPQGEDNVCLRHFKSGLNARDRHLIAYLARGCSSKDWDGLIEQAATLGVNANYWGMSSSKEKLEDLIQNVRDMPTHWAPFANGCQAQFHIKADIPTMRQVFKHKIGAVESEVSRRYVTGTPEVHYPMWRNAAANVKQGSAGTMEATNWALVNDCYGEAVSVALRAYDELLERGVCPEQARFVLPQGTFTEARICNSLYGWANFVKQRRDRAHAQGEVADIADEVAETMAELFPVSWAALIKQPELPVH